MALGGWGVWVLLKRSGEGIKGNCLPRRSMRVADLKDSTRPTRSCYPLGAIALLVRTAGVANASTSIHPDNRHRLDRHDFLVVLSGHMAADTAGRAAAAGQRV